MKIAAGIALVGVSALIYGCVVGSRQTGTATHGPADVDTQRIVHADREPGNWMSVGRTYDEQRFSPLKQIDEHNVHRLGLAWYYDLNTQRGIEGTPIVVDGVMYAMFRLDGHRRARCQDRTGAVALRPQGAARMESLRVL